MLFLKCLIPMCAAAIFVYPLAYAAPSVPQTYEVKIDLGIEHQTIDNFGASDCWSMQMVGGWSFENRNRIADLLFSQTDGIGLSCWRFNLGGGKHLEDIGDPWRTVETFEVDEGRYDWTRQGNEQWFLYAAKARGVEQYVAFVNSPPDRMTRNGLTRCNEGLHTTNLKAGYEGQFACYLADIVEHFHRHPDELRRLTFDWVSPVNEPQWDWTGRSQEGNRASNEDLKRIYMAVGEELERRGLPTKVLGMESGHMGCLHSLDPSSFLRYGKRFGFYLKDFCGDPAVAKYMGNVIGWHSYLCDKVPEPFLSQRQKLGERLKNYPGWRFWQTEYCVMQGPEGAGGGGRDLGMKTALDVARVMHYDLVLTNVSAWQWWLAVSRWDYKDGLIYTDYREEGDPETIYPSKLLWVMGNFSRFVRPGARRVELTGADNLYGLLGSAYRSADGDRLAVVFVNIADEDAEVSLDVNGLPEGMSITSCTPYITSADKDLRREPALKACGACVVPSRSVVTLVAEFASGR